jgi:hypothetical protein
LGEPSAQRVAAPETGPVVADDTDSTADRSLAVDMSATVTLVRWNTAAMISLWEKLGTMTPSFTV